MLGSFPPLMSTTSRPLPTHTHNQQPHSANYLMNLSSHVHTLCNHFERTTISQVLTCLRANYRSTGVKFEPAKRASVPISQSPFFTPMLSSISASCSATMTRMCMPATSEPCPQYLTKDFVAREGWSSLRLRMTSDFHKLWFEAYTLVTS